MEITEKELEKQECIRMCDRLMSLMEKNKEDASVFFRGEILSVYRNITDQAIKETKEIQIKITDI